MRSQQDDRTARARIRDEAFRLFAERGHDAVTVREIASAAGVSPALILRHYGSKDELCTVVDDHAVALFERILAGALAPNDGDPLDAAVLPSVAEVVSRSLPAESPLPDYLARMMLSGTLAGTALFTKLHGVSRDALARMAESGTAESGADPDVRAAFLLINDLAVLMLRKQVREVLGVDPLSSAGLKRWGSEVFAIYRDGLGGIAPGRPSPSVIARERENLDV